MPPAAPPGLCPSQRIALEMPSLHSQSEIPKIHTWSCLSHFKTLLYTSPPSPPPPPRSQDKVQPTPCMSCSCLWPTPSTRPAVQGCHAVPPPLHVLLPLEHVQPPHPSLSDPCVTSSSRLAVFFSGQSSPHVLPSGACSPFLPAPSPGPPSSQLWAWLLAGTLSVFAECMHASCFQIFERLSHESRVSSNLSGSRGTMRTNEWKRQGGRNQAGFTNNIGCFGSH